MLETVFTIFCIAWKAVLILGACLLSYDEKDRSQLKYMNKLSVFALAVIFIGVGGGIFTWISGHFPTNFEYWNTWNFVDDMATVMVVVGGTTLVRLTVYWVRRH